MPRTSNARGAAIAAAADLFRRQGYAATGLEAILAESGAPKGSFYHHFPGGKRDLAVEALSYSRDRVLEWINRVAVEANTAGALVVAIAQGQAAELRESDYQRGCPVSTVALELSGNSDDVANAARTAFERWAEPLAKKLRAAGHTDAEAHRLARWAVANIEGALLLARTAHDATIATDAAAITARALDSENVSSHDS